MILAHGNLSQSDVDELHFWAAAQAWEGSDRTKHIGLLIKNIIHDYELACKIISEHDSLDAEMEGDL